MFSIQTHSGDAGWRKNQNRCPLPDAVTGISFTSQENWRREPKGLRGGPLEPNPTVCKREVAPTKAVVNGSSLPSPHGRDIVGRRRFGMAQAAITNEIGLCCASLNAVESLNETRNRPIDALSRIFDNASVRGNFSTTMDEACWTPHPVSGTSFFYRKSGPTGVQRYG